MLISRIYEKKIASLIPMASSMVSVIIRHQNSMTSSVEIDMWLLQQFHCADIIPADDSFNKGLALSGNSNKDLIWG